MSSSISLISLNLERSKHIDLVLPFLKERKPDVFCAQEICKRDIPALEEVLGMKSVFEPMCYYDEAREAQGIAIFAEQHLKSEATWYGGTEGDIQVLDLTTRATIYETNKHMLLAASVEKDGVTYQFGTTHFPVTDKGEATDFQRESLERLLSALDAYPEIVLCGDFNAPRGREIFSKLTERYKDNIPPEYTSSIDGAIHRDGPIPLMVDGLFTTPEYVASDVSLVSGVSDHCAIVATIARATEK